MGYRLLGGSDGEECTAWVVYCGKRPLTYFFSLTCSVVSVVYLGTKNFKI